MTPLILGKKHVKQLNSMISRLPTPHNINTEVAGIKRYHYSVPAVAHLIGKMLIKFMKLRSSDTVGIEMVAESNDSHKHNDTGTGRDAIFLVNIGAEPFTILYTTITTAHQPYSLLLMHMITSVTQYEGFNINGRMGIVACSTHNERSSILVNRCILLISRSITHYTV